MRVASEDGSNDGGIDGGRKGGEEEWVQCCRGT